MHVIMLIMYVYLTVFVDSQLSIQCGHYCNISFALAAPVIILMHVVHFCAFSTKWQSFYIRVHSIWLHSLLSRCCLATQVLGLLAISVVICTLAGGAASCATHPGTKVERTTPPVWQKYTAAMDCIPLVASIKGASVLLYPIHLLDLGDRIHAVLLQSELNLSIFLNLVNIRAILSNKLIFFYVIFPPLGTNAWFNYVPLGFIYFKGIFF